MIEILDEILVGSSLTESQSFPLSNMFWIPNFHII
jgi:hypothetical protein